MEEAKDRERTIRELMPKIFSSDALAIAFFSVLGTTTTFFVEQGYLGYYDVPKSLIQINVTRIVLSCALIGFASFVFMAISAFILRVLDGQHPMKRALVLPAFFVLMMIIFGFLSGQWLYTLLGSLYILGMVFIPPLRQTKPRSSYLKRLGQRVEERPVILARRLSLINIVVVLCCVYLLVLFLSGMGQKIAESRSWYYVLTDEPTMALVDIYGEVAIFVAFDPESKEIQPQSRIVRLDQHLELTQVNIGRLLKGKRDSSGCDGAQLMGVGATGRAWYQCIMP